VSSRVAGKFQKCDDVKQFQNSFGSLPRKATLEVTQWLFKSRKDNSSNSTRAMRLSERFIRKYKAFYKSSDASSSSSSAAAAAASAGSLANQAEQHQEQSDEDEGGELSNDMFLSTPTILNPFQRYLKYRVDENNLEGFKMAGCDAYLQRSIACIVENTVNYRIKLQRLSEYYQRIYTLHASSVLNNELRSAHARQTMEYVEKSKKTACQDLRSLMVQVDTARTHSLRDCMVLDREQSIAQGRPVHALRSEARQLTSGSYWHLNATSTTLAYSWLLDEFLHMHNARFFKLTAQNLRICKDTWIGFIMYRLGQTSDTWTYIGMPTVVCDAFAKTRVAPSGNFAPSNVLAEGMVNTMKKPTAGLDYVRTVLDSFRKSCINYVPGRYFMPICLA
jgi:hypothetical protein